MKMSEYHVTASDYDGVRVVFTVVAPSAEAAKRAFEYAHPDFTVLNAEEVKKKTFKL